MCSVGQVCSVGDKGLADVVRGVCVVRGVYVVRSMCIVWGRCVVWVIRG